MSVWCLCACGCVFCVCVRCVYDVCMGGLVCAAGPAQRDLCIYNVCERARDDSVLGVYVLISYLRAAGPAQRDPDGGREPQHARPGHRPDPPGSLAFEILYLKYHNLEHQQSYLKFQLLY